MSVPKHFEVRPPVKTKAQNERNPVIYGLQLRPERINYCPVTIASRSLAAKFSWTEVYNHVCVGITYS